MFVATPLRISDVSRSLIQPARTLWSLTRRWAVPVLDRASARVTFDVPLLEGALGVLHPTLSLCAVRAEVVSVVDETHDTNSYWLRPNARFGAYHPGAYVTLELPIDGRTVKRSYSLSSRPDSDGLVCITVKRVPGGLVSNWLADHVRPGQVLTLSAPAGQFVLPARPADKLLMLSAGSGITPVMSMLRQLVATGSACQVVFMHFARSPRDIIFRAELERIAASHANVQLVLCVENAPATDAAWTGARGLFSAELLAEHVPDFRERATFLCGPAGFMQNVMRYFESADADLGKLKYERFDAALDVTRFLDHAQRIRFLRSGAESVSNRPRTILEEAEHAGLQVEHGCRAGNCGTCRCRKQSGVVVDVTTGRESGPGEEFIFPCISVARGTVEVEL